MLEQVEEDRLQDHQEMAGHQEAVGHLPEVRQVREDQGEAHQVRL